MTSIDWKHTGKFCAAAGLLDFASFTYITCLPYLAMRYGAESLELGYVASLRSLAYVVACLTIGRLADRVNRKVLIGLAGAGIVLVYLATAFIARADGRTGAWNGTSLLWALCLSAGVWGVSLSLWWPSFFGWAGDAHAGERLGRSTGAINISWSLGCTVGGPVAGFLYSLGASVPFLAASVFVAVAVSIFLFSGREHSRPPAQKAAAPLPPGAEQNLWAAWVGNLAGTCMLGLMLGVFPRFGQTLGVDTFLFGLFGFALGAGRSAVFAGGIMGLRGLERWSYAAFTMLVAVGMLATVPWLNSIYWLWLVYTAMGVAMGFAYFRGLFASLQHEGSRGAKAAIHEAALVAGILIGSLGGGWIADRWGLRAPYVPIASLVATLVVVQAFLVRSAKKAADKGPKWCVGIDLHGTLLDDRWTVPDALRADLARVLEEIRPFSKVCVCSGNDLAFVHRHVPGQVCEQFDGYVLETGCVFSDGREEAVIIPPSLAGGVKRLEAELKRRAFPEVKYFGSRRITISLFTRDEEGGEAPDALMPKVAQVVEELGLAAEFMVTHSSVAVDIAPKGFDKMTGLRYAAAGAKTVAIADSLNDAHMILGADYAFVPANASPKLVELVEEKGRRVEALGDAPPGPDVVLRSPSPSTRGAIEILRELKGLMAQGEARGVRP